MHLTFSDGSHGTVDLTSWFGDHGGRSLPSAIPRSSSPKIDFSHLAPAERIELMGALWDSLEPVGKRAERRSSLARVLTDPPSKDPPPCAR